MEYTRRELILKLIVEHFIKCAEPVSSQMLIDNYNIECSSATVRNEMAFLEEDGLIEKPYYSSGRIPSTKGYQYYIDRLRQHKLDEEIKNSLQQVFANRQRNIEEVIDEGCRILSQMTNMTIVMLGNASNYDRIRQIQVIPLNEKTAVCLFVCESGQVTNKNFVIPDYISLRDLQECAKVFNDRLAGTSLHELDDKLNAIRPLIEKYVEGFELLFKTMINALLNSDKLAVYGTSKLLEQKEFTKDLSMAKRLLQLVENSSIWSSINKMKPQSKAIEVNIDIPNDAEIDNLSIIKTALPNSKSIAVIGPSRMDYDTIIEAFEFFSEEVKKLLG